MPAARRSDMPKTNLRTEYERATLDERSAGDDPLALFTRWFDEAVAAGGRDPNAMALATSDAQGRPSVRIVLCKEFGPEGFVFFTNYASRKGRELTSNPQAALLFYWPELERQVSVGGTVARASAAESDAYFAQRPLASRFGALASPQSEPIGSRAALEQRVADLEREYEGRSGPPRPAHWGGYRLSVETMEFWQGRPSRLHDRLLYTRRAQGGWQRVRLAP